MQGSDERHRSGKSTKSALREARLAVKLRQNLTRRKAKTRAAGRTGDHDPEPAIAAASVPPDDNGEGD